MPDGEKSRQAKLILQMQGKNDSFLTQSLQAMNPKNSHSITLTGWKYKIWPILTSEMSSVAHGVPVSHPYFREVVSSPWSAGLPSLLPRSRQWPMECRSPILTSEKSSVAHGVPVSLTVHSHNPYFREVVSSPRSAGLPSLLPRSRQWPMECRSPILTSEKSSVAHGVPVSHPYFREVVSSPWSAGLPSLLPRSRQ
ncbi:hypothetical protein ScPMuIL_005324 [Solemya velum]